MSDETNQQRTYHVLWMKGARPQTWRRLLCRERTGEEQPERFDRLCQRIEQETEGLLMDRVVQACNSREAWGVVASEYEGEWFGATDVVGERISARAEDVDCPPTFNIDSTTEDKQLLDDIDEAARQAAIWDIENPDKPVNEKPHYALLRWACKKNGLVGDGENRIDLPKQYEGQSLQDVHNFDDSFFQARYDYHYARINDEDTDHE